MIPVIIESPYKGDVDKNYTYLQECIRHSLSVGEAPFASHQMYTGALDDAHSNERLLGIEAGFTWMRFASFVVFYTDHGMSEGMHCALDQAIKEGKSVLFRRLRKE